MAGRIFSRSASPFGTPTSPAKPSISWSPKWSRSGRPRRRHQHQPRRRQASFADPARRMQARQGNCRVARSPPSRRVPLRISGCRAQSSSNSSRRRWTNSWPLSRRYCSATGFRTRAWPLWQPSAGAPASHWSPPGSRNAFGSVCSPPRQPMFSAAIGATVLGAQQLSAGAATAAGAAVELPTELVSMPETEALPNQDTETGKPAYGLAWSQDSAMEKSRCPIPVPNTPAATGWKQRDAPLTQDRRVAETAAPPNRDRCRGTSAPRWSSAWSLLLGRAAGCGVGPHHGPRQNQSGQYHAERTDAFADAANRDHHRAEQQPHHDSDHASDDSIAGVHNHPGPASPTTTTSPPTTTTTP